MNTIPFELPGFQIQAIIVHDQSLIIKAQSTAAQSCCPDCRTPSTRIHSYYTRSPRDLPCNGRAVQLVLGVRRFRCINEGCQRATFAERLPQLVRLHGQRTQRLTDTLREIGFALGGEAGERILTHLRMTWSADTLLRILRATPLNAMPTPTILGVDDWALRKGHIYGTILVDLIEHRPVDLLPDREAETLAAWLRAHPGVQVISRDRASNYAEGARHGAPGAVQVADRWHLLKNLGDALYRMLDRQPRILREVARAMHRRLNPSPEPSPESDPPTSTAAPAPVDKPLTYRQHRFQQVKTLLAQGHSQRQVARQLHLHRQTVARYQAYDELPRHTAPQNTSKAAGFLPYIQQRLNDQDCTLKQLFHELQSMGFTGSYVSLWRAAKHVSPTDRRKSKRQAAPPVPPFSPRQAMWLLVCSDDQLDQEQRHWRDKLLQHSQQAARAYPLAQRFVQMVKQRQAEALDAWLLDALCSEVPQLVYFARGLQQDYAAVKAALELPWSSGQTEGQITRLKLIKRQMYGRARFDLLRLRVLHPP
jgi:transposase